MGTIARQQIAKRGNFRPERVILGSVARQQIAKQGNFRPEKTILGLTGFFAPSAQAWNPATFAEGAVVGGFLGGLGSFATNAALDAAFGKQAILRMPTESDLEPSKFMGTLLGKTFYGAVLGAMVGGIVANTNLAQDCPSTETQSVDVFVEEGGGGVTYSPDFTTSAQGMLIPSEAEAGYSVDTTIPERVVSDPNMVYYP